MADSGTSDAPAPTLSREERTLLQRIANRSIGHGLEHGRPLPVALAPLPAALARDRAAFVTLEIAGQLRGCIGSLQAHRPLAQDVAENAYRAAFGDPRFARLGVDEYLLLDLHISVLSPPEPMSFTDENDLLRQLRPSIDGLILQDQVAGRPHRGTFLPAVWDKLPDRTAFWQQLKAKANLPGTHWSETLRVWRYTCEPC